MSKVTQSASSNHPPPATDDLSLQSSGESPPFLLPTNLDPSHQPLLHLSSDSRYCLRALPQPSLPVAPTNPASFQKVQKSSWWRKYPGHHNDTQSLYEDST